MLTQASLPISVIKARQTSSTESGIGAMEMMGTVMSFARNAEIYGEGEQVEFLYKVVSGTVRTYKVLADGRRQIGAFYLAGDLFGLEAGDEHTFSAEAVTDCKVLVIKRSAVFALAARNNDVANQLWNLTTRELRRMQGHIMLLIKSAHERVAGFLLEMADRSPARNEFDLPMSRQDIADYLGLTIETISRMISLFRTKRIIRTEGATSIVIEDLDALEDLAQSA